MTSWAVLLGLLGVVTRGAIGFTMERSSAGASGPATWSDSSLDIGNRASVEVLLSGQLHGDDVNNVLRDINREKPAREEKDNCSSSSEEPQRLKRFEETVPNGTRPAIDERIGIETKEPTVDSSSSQKIETSGTTSEKTFDDEPAPRNVVLLLIDDAGIARETMWKNFETSHKFAVQGFLKNCRTQEPQDSAKFSLSEPLVYGGINEACACDRFLRSNVETLLSWARFVNDMSTVTISARNVSAAAHLGSEGSKIRSREAENIEEANAPRQDVPRSSSNLRNSWRMMDLDKQSTPAESSPALGSSSTRQDGPNGYDGMWDVFDMFSRIRIAFFRILLDSLGNLSGPEDEFAGRRAFPVQPSIAELVSDAVRDLKSVSNEKGFMLVAAAQLNEVSAVLDVLDREISTNDSLLVVAGVCSETNEPIPFFAEGRGDANLRGAVTVWDLPGSVRSAIANGCPGKSCSSERRPMPDAVPSVELLSSPQDLPRKRIARAKDEDETSDSTTDEKSTKEIVEEGEESKSTPETGRRSGSGVEMTRPDAVAAIVGIATSVTAMLALNS